MFLIEDPWNDFPSLLTAIFGILHLEAISEINPGELTGLMKSILSTDFCGLTKIFPSAYPLIILM